MGNGQFACPSARGQHGRGMGLAGTGNPLPACGSVTPSLLVLLHRVSPLHWAACQRVLAAVRDVAPVPVCLLLVPRYAGTEHCQRFDAAVGRRLLSGDEPVLQGYMHEDDSPPRGVVDTLRRDWWSGQAEFRRLDCDDALQRLHAGSRWFSVNDWPLAGFCPPRWALGPGAWAALRLSALRYVLTRDGLQVLRSGQRWACHRILPQRGGALRRAWSALPGSLGQDSAPLLRLELTPDAADDPNVRRAWQGVLYRHLMYRRACTPSALLSEIEQRTPAPTVTPPASTVPHDAARLSGAPFRG